MEQLQLFNNLKKKLNLIVLAFAFLFLISNVSAYWWNGLYLNNSFPSIDNNMVCYYHFNNQSSVGENYGVINKTYDYSNAKNNGTYFQNPLYNKTGGFLQDGSFSFDQFKYVNTTLNFNYSKGSSVSMWFYKNNATVTSNLLQKNLDFDIQTDNAGRIVVESIGDSFHYIRTNPSMITNNTWYFLVVVFNASNDGEIYINGVPSRTAKTVLNWNYTTNYPVYLGRETSASFNGTIDEFIFWNRTLSQYEIKNLYGNQCNPLSSENWTNINGSCSYSANINNNGNLWTLQNSNISVTSQLTVNKIIILNNSKLAVIGGKISLR